MSLSLRPPLIPEVGVLALPYHQWGPLWLTPHYVLPRLAEYFHVVWLNAPVHWREFRALHRGAQGSEELPPGFQVRRSRVPDLYRPAALRRLLFRRRVEAGWKCIDALGCTTRVLHLWHPQFEEALDVGPYDLSVYHIDDEYTFSSATEAVTLQEARVIRRVGQAFAISPALMERKGGINPNLAFVPEGVDSELYMRPAREPLDLASIPHPRIGYTGSLKRHLDWPLLRDLARRHQGWSFVFVGPRQFLPEHAAIVDEMARYENVHMLGQKTANVLATYPQHFDVCVMPYFVNNYTNNIYPLKLHEYLASGRPVVGSPIRSLLDFADVLALAAGPDAWSDALSAALAGPSNTAEAVSLRQAIAQEHDWRRLIHRIATTICERLDADLAARVRAVDLDATFGEGSRA